MSHKFSFISTSFPSHKPQKVIEAPVPHIGKKNIGKGEISF